MSCSLSASPCSCSATQEDNKTPPKRHNSDWKKWQIYKSGRETIFFILFLFKYKLRLQFILKTFPSEAITVTDQWVLEQWNQTGVLELISWLTIVKLSSEENRVTICCPQEWDEVPNSSTASPYKIWKLNCLWKKDNGEQKEKWIWYRFPTSSMLLKYENKKDLNINVNFL